MQKFLNDNLRPMTLAIALGFTVTWTIHSLTTSPSPTIAKTIPLPLPSAASPPPVDNPKALPESLWQSVTIQNSDTLISIATRLGISYNILQQILTIPKAKLILAHLQVGNTLDFHFNADQELSALRYVANEQETLLLERHDQEWIANITHKPFIPKLIYKSTSLQSTYLSPERTGISAKLYAQLKNIFHGTVNINRELRPGDHLSVIYEEFFLNGKLHHTGNIRLATLIHHHKVYQAIRYTDSTGHTGYYTPHGQALQHHALFLPAPVKYTRISDYFTLHRYHPILHIVRPHLGVDYAAPTGTPVKAVASGRITFSGSAGGYGTAVMIRHNNEYKTLYAHMHHLNRSVKTGQWVEQGDVIGYVGSTGLATGHHLHFGLYVNGVAKNPLQILAKVTGSKSVPEHDMANFLAKTNQLLSQLALFESQNHNNLNG